MMNMKPGLLSAAISFASLLALAPAASAEQSTSEQQFSVTVVGAEKPMVWDGKSYFQTGDLSKSAEVVMRPARTVDGRSEFFVDGIVKVLQTYTTGSGETMQSLQVPEGVPIQQACHIAVGEECVVEVRGVVAARVTRTR